MFRCFASSLIHTLPRRVATLQRHSTVLRTSFSTSSSSHDNGSSSSTIVDSVKEKSPHKLSKKPKLAALTTEQLSAVARVFAGDFGSDTIDLKAFRDGCSAEKSNISAAMIESVFQEIDTDNDGKIRFDDLKAAWPKNESNWAWLGGARGMKQSWSARQVLLTTPLRVHLCGAGYFGGQPVPGVDRGPAAVRAHDVAGSIESLGWLLNDSGDLKLPTFEFDPPAHVESGGFVRTPRSVGAATRIIHDTLLPHASKGEFCLTVGGDHSLAMGTLAAVASAWGRERLRVLWVDAHADINTPATSPSGNLHGMPLGFLLDLAGNKSVPGFEWMRAPYLKPHQIAYIGLRDVDEGEKVILHDLGIKCFSMSDVDRLGIGTVIANALSYLSPNRDNPIHLSFDIDSLDPLIAPSTGTRVRGGLTYREGCLICEELSSTGQLVSMDLVEVNPSIGSLGDVAETASAAVGLIRSALGQTLL